jgi:hypothetical protein
MLSISAKSKTMVSPDVKKMLMVVGGGTGEKLTLSIVEIGRITTVPLFWYIFMCV